MMTFPIVTSIALLFIYTFQRAEYFNNFSDTAGTSTESGESLPALAGSGGPMFGIVYCKNHSRHGHGSESVSIE